MMSMMFIMFPRAAVAADRIAEVLEKEESIADPEEPVPFRENFQPTIEFRNVDFAYPGGEDAVLHNINFLAPAGQTTAIIGSTGSGKSTLLNLLMRFYDVTAGEILVDGQDIRTVTKRSLREKSGYIPQKSMLFSGSIRSNLSYGDKKASRETLVKAAEIVQANEFIAVKEEGYDSVIAQGGDQCFRRSKAASVHCHLDSRPLITRRAA